MEATPPCMVPPLEDFLVEPLFGYLHIYKYIYIYIYIYIQHTPH